MMITKEDVVVLVDAVIMGTTFFYILFDSNIMSSNSKF
jgi:hypothetical protein